MLSWSITASARLPIGWFALRRWMQVHAYPAAERTGGVPERS